MDNGYLNYIDPNIMNYKYVYIFYCFITLHNVNYCRFLHYKLAFIHLARRHCDSLYKSNDYTFLLLIRTAEFITATIFLNLQSI